MECISCHKGLTDAERAASVSGSIMGDEYTDVYYLCGACQAYTVATWHDRFCGEESVSLSGPRSKQEGDEIVSQIRQCARPWDKRCRCAVHRAYFRDALD